MMRTRKSIQKDTVDSSQNFFHLLYSPNGIDRSWSLYFILPRTWTTNKLHLISFFLKDPKIVLFVGLKKLFIFTRVPKKKQRCSFLTSIYIKKRNSTVQKSSLESTHPPLRPSKILSFMFISAFDFICYLYEKNNQKSK